MLIIKKLDGYLRDWVDLMEQELIRENNIINLLIPEVMIGY